MSIHSILLENIKTHKRTEIPLSRLTVLVGPNSVGKTSVLSAIRYVSHIGKVWRETSKSRMTAWLRRGEDACSIRLFFDADKVLSLGIHLAPKNKLPWTFDWKTELNAGSEESHHARPDTFQLQNGFRVLIDEYVGEAMLLRLKAECMAKPSRMELGANTTTLESDGTGLAGVLGIIRITDSHTFEAIVQNLRAIVPSLSAIHLVKTKFAETYFDDENQEEHEVEVDGLKLHFDFEGASNIPAEEVSEGTLLALGILTAAHARKAPNILLIDDLEHALHPQAQRELIGHLRKILDAVPGLQIVATSHSPYLVDAFEPEEVVVFGLRKDGSTAARCLSEHPDIKGAMEVLSTGEFLSSAGEEWLLGEPV